MIDHRVRLAKQITKFNSDSPIPDDLFDTLLSPVDQEDGGAMEDDDFDDEKELDEEEERDEEDEEDGEETIQLSWEGAKKLNILLPSCYVPNALKGNGFNHLIKQEQELRQGQMNDALHSLRQSLGDKAWLLQKKLRNVKSYKAKVRFDSLSWTKAVMSRDGLLPTILVGMPYAGWVWEMGGR